MTVFRAPPVRAASRCNVSGTGALERVVQTGGILGPGNVDDMVHPGNGNVPGYIGQRTGGEGHGEVHLPKIEARLQAEQVARELPRRATGPLVAMAPARVEDFEPGGAAIPERPAPTRAVLAEHKVHVTVLDEFGQREMPEIGRDELRVVRGRIAETRRGGIVWKAAQHVCLQEGPAGLRLGFVKEPQPQAQRRTVVADPGPRFAGGRKFPTKIARDDRREIARHRPVVRGAVAVTQHVAPAGHVAHRGDAVQINPHVTRAGIADITPVDEAPADAVLQSVGRTLFIERRDVALGVGEHFLEQRAIAGQFPIMQAGGDPLRSVGREIAAVARAEAGDKAVVAGALGALDESTAAHAQVGKSGRGDVHADTDDVARPLAALARGAVGERVLGAGAVRLNADRPDLVQQRVARPQCAGGLAVIYALQHALAVELYRRRGGKDVQLEETSASRGEREEFLPAAASGVVVEIAGRARRKRDPRIHAARDERLAVGELDHGASGQLEFEVRAHEPHAAKVVAAPDALWWERGGREVAQEEPRGRIVFIVAEDFDERAAGEELDVVGDRAGVRARQRLQRADGARHGYGRGPVGVVKCRRPPFGHFARVAPFDVAEHEIDEADGRDVARKPQAFPAHGDFAAAGLRRAREERIHGQQAARGRAQMADLDGEHVAAGAKFFNVRLVFRESRREARRTLAKIVSVDPAGEPRGSKDLKANLAAGRQLELTAKRDIVVFFVRLVIRVPEERQLRGGSRGGGGHGAEAGWNSNAGLIRADSDFRGRTVVQEETEGSEERSQTPEFLPRITRMLTDQNSNIDRSMTGLNLTDPCSAGVIRG